MEEKPPWKLQKASLSLIQMEENEEEEEEEVCGKWIPLGREENKVFIQCWEVRAEGWGERTKQSLKFAQKMTFWSESAVWFGGHATV